MAQMLKESTAVDVLIGPFVDILDGATAETGESPTVKLSKNGQALAAKNDVTTPVSDADGYYNCELDATDTNTVGTLILTVAASATALPVRHEFQVIETNVYDALYASGADGFGTDGVTLATSQGNYAPAKAGDAMDLVTNAVDTASVATGAIDADALGADCITAAKIADNAFVAANFATSSLDGKGDWNVGKTGYSLTQTFPTNFADMAITVTSGQVTVGTNNDKTGYTASTVSDKTGYSISGTKTTLDALNDVSTTEVNAEVDTALADIGLDHLISSALPTNWATDVAANSVFDNIADDGTAAFDRTTDSLQAVADSGGGGPTAAQIADAVWDEDLEVGHAVADSAAIKVKAIEADTNELQTDDIPGTLALIPQSGGTTSWNATALGAINAEADTALTDYDPPTRTELTSDIGTVTALLPAALVGGRIDADMGAISTSTDAADKLEESTETLLLGTVSGTPTTTTLISDITVTDDDQFKGRIIIFRTATDAGLVRQATDITGCTASTDTLTFTALTVAPTSGDTIIIV